MNQDRSINSALQNKQGFPEPVPLLSFFTGAGFMDIGFHQQGFHSVWHNEYHEPFRNGFEHALSSMGYNGASAKIQNIRSITEVGPHEIIKEAFSSKCPPTMFGMIGGPPCPDFSVGGKNRGKMGGSGTSRNQPETILANLPYVEWFKISNKKHLTLVEAPSHHFGTLKQLDAVKAEVLKSLIKQAAANAASSVEPAHIITVSRDISAHAEILEQSTGIKPQALEMGTYEFSLPSCRLLLASESAVEGELSPGTYLVLKGNPAGQPKGKVQIAGSKYTVAESEGLCLLFEN